MGEGMGWVNRNEGEKSQNSSVIGKNWEGSNGISEGSWAVRDAPSDLVFNWIFQDTLLG